MRVKSKSAVLHMLLGSPNYISGQELANRLGVSRQTVGKCVQQLREEGYKIEATQRLGYKFLGDNNLVTAEVLTPRLHCPLEPIYYATVDSTNTEAKRLLNAGYRGNFLVVADRRPRPPGQAVLFSPGHRDLYDRGGPSRSTAAGRGVCDYRCRCGGVPSH